MVSGIQIASSYGSVVHGFLPNSFSWAKMAAATPAFTCHSRQQEELWKTKHGHEFLGSSPTEKWGLCPHPLSGVLCALEDGRSDVIPVSKSRS